MIELILLAIGTPTILDRGTKKSIVTFVQPTLRSQHTDIFAAETSFRYEKSSSNYLCIYILLLMMLTNNSIELTF